MEIVTMVNQFTFNETPSNHTHLFIIMEHMLCLLFSMPENDITAAFFAFCPFKNRARSKNTILSGLSGH